MLGTRKLVLLAMIGGVALQICVAGAARAQSCILSGFVLEERDSDGDGDLELVVPIAGTQLRIHRVGADPMTDRTVDITQAPVDPARHGRYECTNCFAGLNTVQLVRGNAPVGDIQSVTCEPRRDFTFRNPSDANRRDPGRVEPEHAYACVVSGTVTMGGAAIADGDDYVICSSGLRVDPEFESSGDNPNFESPVLNGRYRCRVGPGQVRLTLKGRQRVEDEKLVCATPCRPLPAIPNNVTVPTAPTQIACNVDFPNTLVPPGPPGPNCTLAGTVRKNGAVPPPSEQIKCTPNGAWSAINDTSGSYSCATQQGTVSLTLSSGYGGTKTCTCADTTTTCNPSF